ncbi:alpha-N-acetylglucosaminidase-like [Impatiens glandulifera]|uniref:alpha-N-acetylglucosaminidase-like n=1 Tax=Impatiens glandulifera TaxID=253017 RepID=UPI001FB154AF|nr:alpha-N-acetylglucosaminidase-like [Impatiens glandulifera]
MTLYFVLVIIFCLFSLLVQIQSSTIGVSYISRLLHTQDRERTSPSVQVAAVRSLVNRLIPSHSSTFDFQIISKEQCGGESCFILTNHPSFNGYGTPEILISGFTGVELGAGLHWYLKNWCGLHISWDKTGGVQLSTVPKSGSLPRLDHNGILVQRPVPWNYYQNAVTSSYTFVWWDWERWQKEIDWMVLQGVNLPLAFTGQEAIWQKVFRSFNISNSDLNDFFGGPAFLAWSRMGNLHGWGGPLAQSWLDQQLILQKKILTRMHEFGMTPVLPAFSGNVPAALKIRFPSAKITHLGNWFTVRSDPRWCCTYLLDATDPLFTEIGEAFVKQQRKEYGMTSHIYNCDTFDENTPPIDDPDYISSLGAAIFKGMQNGDKDAVWLMQGWLFSYDPFWRPPQMKALLHSVPLGRMVVLDLFAEVKPIWITSEQFYGIPYIWCMLHNFAGNSEMYGVLDAVGSGPVEARTSENSTMVGVGMSMEGIEQNPIVYDLMAEMAFRHDKVDVKTWIDKYSIRRYGKLVSSMQDAWNILYHSIYNCTDGSPNKNRDTIVAFPDVDPHLIVVTKAHSGGIKQANTKWASLEEETDDSYDKPHLWYETSEVIKALQLFLTSGDELSGSNTYRYDLIDLTRQVLSKHANQLFLKIIKAYQSNDKGGVDKLSRSFLELIEDTDALLACHEGFLLGPWLESAKKLGLNDEQRRQYEWNARTQITMWFDNTDEKASLLRDYANKYWSGLLRGYYGPRATIYFKHLIQSLEKGEKFPLKAWRMEWIALTNNWQLGQDLFPTRPIAADHALNISRWIYDKYFQPYSDHAYI